MAFAHCLSTLLFKTGKLSIMEVVIVTGLHGCVTLRVHVPGVEFVQVNSCTVYGLVTGKGEFTAPFTSVLFAGNDGFMG
jgi:hypothetical protein